MSKFYGIGVGPGDSELLTVKGLRIIRECDVVICPSAMEGGESIAYNTVKDFLDKDKDVRILHFPMGKDDTDEKVFNAYKIIEECLDSGKDVAFLTLGDPYVYSTYIHLLTHFKEEHYEVETIPGITSFCAAASIVDTPLVVGDEPLMVIPAISVDRIKDEKFVVIMKVYKREEEVINVLEEKGFKYVLVSRAGREGQKVLYKKEDILNHRDYMSLIIASRN